MQAIPLGHCKLATENPLNFPHRIAKLPVLVPVAQRTRPSLRDRFFVNGTKLPQPRNRRRNQAQGELNVIGRILLAQAEPEAASRPLRRQSHRGQNMRRLDGP